MINIYIYLARQTIKLKYYYIPNLSGRNSIHNVIVLIVLHGWHISYVNNGGCGFLHTAAALLGWMISIINYIVR